MGCTYNFPCKLRLKKIFTALGWVQVHLLHPWLYMPKGEYRGEEEKGEGRGGGKGKGNEGRERKGVRPAHFSDASAAYGCAPDPAGKLIAFLPDP